MEYKFKINAFEGPLDLLLHLIKESEMDIMDIEIVSLTNQYLKYIEDMENLDLLVASEYLVMASELMLIKSRYLLPITNEEEVEDDYIEVKDNLIKRLIEYKQYKEVTGTFKELEEKRKEIFTKEPSDLKEYSSNEVVLGEDISLEELLKAFQKYLDRKRYEMPTSTKITSKEISIEERINNIRKILKDKTRIEFFELFEDISKPYVVVTFLSILEMSKKRELRIIQENNFDKIYCEVF